MAESRPISVIGSAMWTAAGHDAPSSIAAMQVGMGSSVESPLWDFTGGKTLKAFRVNAHQWWEGESFLVELASVVLQQALDQITALDIADAAKVPVLIAVAPPDRPARTDRLEQILLGGLQARLGGDLPDGSGVLAEGKTGVVSHLRRARDQSAKHPVQIVLGVESLLRQEIVRHYIEANRMMCQAGPVGFIPGEAASAVILARPAATGLPEILIKGIGEAAEQNLTDDSPPAVTGLTTAIRQALREAGTQMYDVGVILSDLNGEHGKFKENMIGVMRNDSLPPEGVSRRPRGMIEHWNAAEAIGEVGAAFLPAALGWAHEAGRQGILPMPKVLLHAGEDNGTRVAVAGEFSG